MSKGAKMMVAALAANGFFRLGREWPKAGVLVDGSEFTEDEWALLIEDVNLKVRPANEDDLANASGSDNEERRAKIAEAIETLTPDDFQSDGKPKLHSLNTLLGKDFGGKVSGNERDSVWDAMTDEGFAAPVAAS